MSGSSRAGLSGALFAGGLVVGLVLALFAPPATGPAASEPADVTAAPVARFTDAPEDDDCQRAPLRRRAAQVLVVGLPGVSSSLEPLAQELTALGVGGVFINKSNVSSSDQVRALTAGLQEASDLPLLVTTDEESGRVSSFRALTGPTSAPRTLAAMHAPEGVRDYAALMGARLADLGINVDLAPVADLDDGVWSGVIGDRSFSGDPLTAASYAQAFADGLIDAGVLPVVKHFPGHGRAGDDVHRRSSRVDTPLEELLSTDVLPFVSLIDAGAPIVMLGHVSYDALEARRPASMSPAAYELLRDLGFEGVAITDSIGMGAIHRRWDFPQAAVRAIAAGADAVLATDGREADRMTSALVRAVRRGTLDEARLDEAVARILALKGVDPQGWTCATPGPLPAMAQRSLLRGNATLD